MILSRFDRFDGAGHAYSLAPAGADVTRHFARNMHATPGDTYPGQHAALAWEHVRSWFVPDRFGRTTRDAMIACGVPR
jgi:hypothetical protein